MAGVSTPLADVSGGKPILNPIPFYGAGIAYQDIADYTPRAVTIRHRIPAIGLLLLSPSYSVLL